MHNGDHPWCIRYVADGTFFDVKQEDSCDFVNILRAHTRLLVVSNANNAVVGEYARTRV